MSLIPTLFGYDATGPNEHLLPTDIQAAGYDTGFDIAWTQAQYDRHMLPYPAIHYDQDSRASDPKADLLDVEAGAATDAEIVGWLDNARSDFYAIARPGQRWPGLYMSENNVPGAVAILQKAGLINVPFVVANYNITMSEAERRVSHAVGPYPAVGYQFTDREFGGLADGNIFSIPWLTTVSQLPLPKEEKMVILRTNTSSGGSITYTYDGTTVNHIVSPADQATFAAVLPIVNVTRQQLESLGVTVP